MSNRMQARGVEPHTPSGAAIDLRGLAITTTILHAHDSRRRIEMGKCQIVSDNDSYER
jgi:hypothetical protein